MPAYGYSPYSTVLAKEGRCRGQEVVVGRHPHHEGGTTSAPGLGLACGFPLQWDAARGGLAPARCAG